jgi:hypothetical protein
MRVVCVSNHLFGVKLSQRSVHTALHAWSPRCALQTRQTTNTRLGKTFGDRKVLRTYECCQLSLPLSLTAHPLTTKHKGHVCRQAESSQYSIHSIHPRASIQHGDSCSHAGLWADDCLSQNAAGACDQLAGPALCLHLSHHCNCHCYVMSLSTQVTTCSRCCCSSEPILAIMSHL